MTELAALNIRITGDSGDLKAAVSQATTELQKVQDTAQRANAAVGTAGLGGGMGRLGKASNMLKGNVQNASFQLQDMVVQLQMGTRWTTVMAQQLPQLAGGFGAVGAAVGILAAVGFSALGMALATTGEEVSTFEDSLESLRNVTDQLKAAQDILTMSLPELYAQYGMYAAAVRDAAAALVELNAAQAQNALNAAITDAADALRNYTGAASTAFSSGVTMGQGLTNIRREFGLVGMEARDLQMALNQLRRAETFEQQLAAARNLKAVMDATGVSVNQLPPALRDALIQVNQLVIAGAELKREVQNGTSAMNALRASAPGSAWLSSAIGQAGTLAATLWDAAAAVAAAGGGQGDATGGNFPVGSRGRSRPKAAPSGLGGVDWGAAPKAAGGGGGGGVKETPQDELEQFMETLMTEAELEADQYALRQAKLKEFLDQKLLTQQEYNDAIEQLQKDHSEKMSAIDAYRYGDAALKAETFMGDMATAFAMGNERMQKAARGFAAVEALINAWRAYSQTLADPSLPFIAKFAAAAKVLAAGMGAVNAIKGGGKGGGSSAGAGAASSGGGVTEMRTANINFYGGFQPTQETIRMIAGGLNDWLGDGGKLNVGGA